MYVSTNLINKSIDRIGELVSVEVYSGKSYSDWGDLTTATTTYYSIRSIFNTYGQNQNYVQEGSLEQARFSFFFKGPQAGVAIDNVIVRANGDRWKITKVHQHAAEGTNVVQEASVSNG